MIVAASVGNLIVVGFVLIALAISLLTYDKDNPFLGGRILNLLLTLVVIAAFLIVCYYIGVGVMYVVPYLHTLLTLFIYGGSL